MISYLFTYLPTQHACHSLRYFLRAYLNTLHSCHSLWLPTCFLTWLTFILITASDVLLVYISTIRTCDGLRYFFLSYLSSQRTCHSLRLPIRKLFFLIFLWQPETWDTSSNVFTYLPYILVTSWDFLLPTCLLDYPAYLSQPQTSYFFTWPLLIFVTAWETAFLFTWVPCFLVTAFVNSLLFGWRLTAYFSLITAYTLV